MAFVQRGGVPGGLPDQETQTWTRDLLRAVGHGKVGTAG
jgi:hypothetical protein